MQLIRSIFINYGSFWIVSRLLQQHLEISRNLRDATRWWWRRRRIQIGYLVIKFGHLVSFYSYRWTFSFHFFLSHYVSCDKSTLYLNSSIVGELRTQLWRNVRGSFRSTSCSRDLPTAPYIDTGVVMSTLNFTVKAKLFVYVQISLYKPVLVLSYIILENLSIIRLTLLILWQT